MHNTNQIAAEIELVDTLRMLTEAYEEISVLRMQRVKNSVLVTRDFLDRLISVFYDVKVGYRREILKRFGKKKDKSGKVSFSTIAKNGKTVSVLITANAHLYGDIVQKVFNLFIKDIQQRSTDVVIVGRHGKELFDQKNLGIPYTFYQVPDSNISSNELAPLTNAIINYENVIVYYGRFLNVVTQEPTAVNITGEQSFEGDEGVDERNRLQFYFEPSLERILYFFETQVFASLMKQAAHEGELSRHASRIRAMEEAISHINDEYNKLVNDLRRAKKLAASKRQLDSLSGVYLWSKK